MNSQLSTRHRGLCLQVSLDPSRQPIVREASTLPDSNILKGKPRKTQKPVEVKVGSATVKLYRRKWRDKARGRDYHSWMIIWRDARGRHREKRTNRDAAEARAEQIATSIVNGHTDMLAFTPADRATLLRCRELLQSAGITKPLELVVGEYIDSSQILSGRSLPEMARAQAAAHPVGLIARNMSALVDEFFLKRRMSAKWRRIQKLMLDRFALKFPGQFSAVQARELEDWLDALRGKKQKPVGLRTRRNYLQAIQALASYAMDRGYLAKEWAALRSVADPEPEAVNVHLYTPEELAALLATAERTESGRKLVPLICITAFAGVRHGEMSEKKVRLLDWADLDFEASGIYVATGAAKTGNDRVVDMPANLIAWLRPYVRPKGKICPLAQTYDALCKLRKRAVQDLLDQAERFTKGGSSARAEELRELARTLAGPKRNALRKSFISYKNALTRNIDLVADQAGNSPAMIRKNYKRTDTRMVATATRWFSLMPTRADVLPLFEWQASRV